MEVINKSEKGSDYTELVGRLKVARSDLKNRNTIIWKELPWKLQREALLMQILANS